MMTRRAHKLRITALAGCVMIAGCDETGLALQGAQTDPATATQTTEVVERDIEMPELFQENDRGVWDGRASLGGIWVAHPDVADPVRVLIRNQDNGKFVIGALFHKGFTAPGPVFQISSEAAAALDLEAGQPALLNVTALKREDAPQIEPEASTEGRALGEPFVQVEVSSSKAEADHVAGQLLAAGIQTRTFETEVSGRPFWRVVAGPAATEDQRARLLHLVLAQGYTDAFFTSN